MGACKYKRGEYCGLRNDIRAKSLGLKSYCIEGPCPDEKPQTNADRIRSMTDEELAIWLSENAGPSAQGWLLWLKMEWRIT